MDRLFVVDKPPFVGSNHYLGRIKRKYGIKKAGFSGTLDPFASGTLVVAFGKYTRLFRFLKKSPKCYQATIWLGATSPTLDIEKVETIAKVPKLNDINLDFCKGEFCYTPPKYSAKRIQGKRAYDLARDDVAFELPTVSSTIYDIKLLNYNHPFLTFEAVVSEGTYIRSLAQQIVQHFNTTGTLSALMRKYEGKFVFDGEKALNPLAYLNTKENFYLGDSEDIALGRKLRVEQFKYQDEGVYHLCFETFFCILSIKEGAVHYEINNLKRHS